MKAILVLSLVLLAIISFAQHPQPPEYILNGHKISWENTYLNPDNIDSVHVSKTSDTGTVFIYSKKNPPWNF